MSNVVVGGNSPPRDRLDTETTPQMNNNSRTISGGVDKQQHRETLLQYSPSPVPQYSSVPFPPAFSKHYHIQHKPNQQQQLHTILHPSSLEIPALHAPRSPLPCSAPNVNANAMCVSPIQPPTGSDNTSIVSSLSNGSFKQIVVAGTAEDEDAPFIPPDEITIPLRHEVPDWLRDVQESAPAHGETRSPVRENAPTQFSVTRQEFLQYPAMPPPPLWTGAPSPARLRPSLGRNNRIAERFSSYQQDCPVMNTRLYSTKNTEAIDVETESEKEASVVFMDEVMYYQIQNHHLFQHHQLQQQQQHHQQEQHEIPSNPSISINSPLLGDGQHSLEIPSTSNHASLLGQRPRRRHHRNFSSTTLVSVGSLVGQSSYITAPTAAESSLSMSTSDRYAQTPEGLTPTATKHRHSLVRNEIKYMWGKMSTPVRHLIKTEDEISLVRSSGCLT